MLLFVGCKELGNDMAAPGGFAHRLKVGDTLDVQPTVTQITPLHEAAYVSIKKELIGPVTPDYTLFDNRPVASLPMFYPAVARRSFADSARAGITKTSPVLVAGSWPGWKPHIPTQKGKTKFELDYLGEDNGLKSIFNTIRCITQDRQGNIWLGTLSNVYKYDGTGFYLFAQEEGIEKRPVSALLSDRQGNTWIGQNGAIRDSTAGNLYRWDGNQLARFTTGEGLSSNYITCLLETAAGDIWIGNPRGIDVWDGEAISHFTSAEGFPFPLITSLTEDATGRIWIGTQKGLFYWDSGQFYDFATMEGWNEPLITSILEDRTGQIWIGTNQGLFAWTGTGFRHFDNASGLHSNFIFSLGEDAAGNIWIGNEVYDVWNGRAFRSYTEQEGFKSENAMKMFRDHAGNLWLIHHYGYGASILKKDGFIDMTPPFYADKYKTDSYLLADQSGKMLIGNFGKGMHVWDGKGYSHFTAARQFTNDVYKLLQDRNGNWWVGSMEGLWVWGEDGVTKYDIPTYSLMADGAGNVWI
ncbi:MAG: hypothetical protein KDC44_22180, partial [Phaeodactylibacter sp.]|nr:hypothetical protein [Phaeodactylibacter sp.]